MRMRRGPWRGPRRGLARRFGCLIVLLSVLVVSIGVLVLWLLTTLLGLGGREGELALHVRGALRNGLTPDEIGEVLLHTAVYAGVPASNAALAIAERVLAEEGAIGGEAG
jgi:hypothetical protein